MKKIVFIIVCVFSQVLIAQVTDTGGNVGVGTISPTAKLEVNTGASQLKMQGDGGVYGYNINVNATGGWARNYSFSSNNGVRAHMGTLGSNNTLTYLYFDTNNETDAIGYQSPEMVILKNGNVGIGTTSPASKLHIKGGIGGEQLRFERGGGVVRLVQPSGLDDLYYYNGGGTLIMALDGSSQNVGIGTTTPDEKLSVNGNIHTKEVRVDLTGWSDFVFKDSYDLPSLSEVENHIKQNGHLKDIPSAKDVEDNGILLGEMNAKLLQKIEELTLYTIKQEKEIANLKDYNLKKESEEDDLGLIIKMISELQNRLKKMESKTDVNEY